MLNITTDTALTLIYCKWLLCAICLHTLSLSPLLFPPFPSPSLS